MTKNTNTLIPEIRFPEFLNDGNWEEKKLNKLGNLINGLTYSPTDIREKGLLVLRSSNVQNGQIVLNDCVYVTPEIKGANLTKEDDILVCIRNGSKALIGKNAIIPKDIQLATHGAFMTVFRAEHPKFVFQLFQTDTYNNQVNADLGATINSINGKNFLKYKFLVPKPLEQQKIASCLSSLDELIVAHNQRLDVLKDHKKGLMQNLFPQEGETIPKYRFPEFLNDGPWEEKKLNKLGNLINGLTYSPNDIREKGLLVLRSSNIQNGQIVLNDCVYVTPEIKGANLTQENDILVCIRNGSKALIGKNAIIRKAIQLATHGAFMTVFRAEHPKFVFQLFQTDAYNKQVNADLGATINSINGKNFLKYKFIVPKPQEQQKIASCLSSLDELISAQSEKIEQLKLHKKGLMQGLFPKINY
ncbi:restriction endonuclease subunit S [Flavobacterium sp. JLP]|uniref:restriction endonuclease subunit S n=1 Tax=Flavobacterium sp. JLP TaxID=2783793 RepID=UPI00188A13D7|nr:restriction endonuclease subunit S [Flavobacterium sp. JLP]MBF4505256.1 restriction endonuclease subunit S [Flavobacterium sp. JLP]